MRTTSSAPTGSPCSQRRSVESQITAVHRVMLAVMVTLCVPSSVVVAAEGDDVEYTFGRPVKDGEQTYDWYRKTHTDWAAKRYGVDPKKVGDGMDTWPWWCGAD